MNNSPSTLNSWDATNLRHAEIHNAVASERAANRGRAGQTSNPPALKGVGLVTVRGFVGRILINAGNRIAGVATPTSTSQTTSTAKS